MKAGEGDAAAIRRGRVQLRARSVRGRKRERVREREREKNERVCVCERERERDHNQWGSALAVPHSHLRTVLKERVRSAPYPRGVQGYLANKKSPTALGLP